MWRTIDTAPRDDSLVLVYENIPVTAYSLPNGEFVTLRDEIIDPTHWMPLPESPFNDTP